MSTRIRVAVCTNRGPGEVAECLEALRSQVVPEDLVVVASSLPEPLVTGHSEAWPATVSLIEPLGDETLVFLDYGGPVSLVAKVTAEEKVAVGDRRSFALRPERLVLFDLETGGRIVG